MFLFYNEYQFIFVYFNICLFFVIFLLIALYVCAVYAPYSNNGLHYGCGFCYSSEIFNLQFYILALLLFIFGFEILLLLSLCFLIVSIMGWGAYIRSMVFLLFLTLGIFFFNNNFLKLFEH